MEHVVTCHTPGCVNDGIPITITTVMDDPGIPPPQVVYCGPCQQPVTDIIPPLSLT